MKPEMTSVLENLNFMVREYDGLNRMLTQTKNRLHHLNPDAQASHQDDVQALEKIKDRFSRRIGKELEFFPVWAEWASKIPGAGPWVVGTLLLLWSVKWQAVCGDCGADLPTTIGSEKNGGWTCPECGKTQKGEGITRHEALERDFPTISKWWAFLGVHTVDGKKPKRKKGIQSNWSTRGRLALYQFGEQAIKQTAGPYRAVYDEIKAKKERTRPELSKGHRHAMARNETAKLFAAHFWTVARTLEGKPVSKPYAHAIMGHTNYVEPFLWEPPDL